jgi:hypothetical protein
MEGNGEVGAMRDWRRTAGGLCHKSGGGMSSIAICETADHSPPHSTLAAKPLLGVVDGNRQFTRFGNRN